MILRTVRRSNDESVARVSVTESCDFFLRFTYESIISLSGDSFAVLVDTVGGEESTHRHGTESGDQVDDVSLENRRKWVRTLVSRRDGVGERRR